MPIISVVMGVYDSDPEKLKKAVDSVLEQTVTDFEFIICDDASRKEIAMLLDEMADGDARIKVIHLTENKGLANALNTCIYAASGEFIARQDDDDYSAKERFSKQLDFFEKNPDIDFIGSDCALFDENGIVYGERNMPAVVKKEDFLFNSPFIHGSMMFRKRVFENSRYRTIGKSRKNEDYDLFMRLTADGFKSANINEKLYFFFYDAKTRRVSFAVRKDEYRVRKENFKKLGLMPKGFFYALKPLVLGIVPHGIIMKLKSKCGKI